MGGIKSNHIQPLKNLGVKIIAVVTEITMADNVYEKSWDLMDLIKR